MYDDDFRDDAEAILIKAKYGERCPCGRTVLTGFADEPKRRAYAIATNMVKRRDIDATRGEFIASVAAAIEEARGRCPDCRRSWADNRAEDHLWR